MIDKMKQLYEMQKQAKQMQKTVEAIKIEKTSPGGKIRIVMNGKFKVEELSLDESLFDPSQKAPVEKALSAIITEAAEEVGQKSAEQAMDMMKQMNIKLPGF